MAGAEDSAAPSEARGRDPSWAQTAGKHEQDTGARRVQRRGTRGRAGGAGGGGGRCLARLRQGPPLSAAGMALARLWERRGWRRRGRGGKGRRWRQPICTLDAGGSGQGGEHVWGRTLSTPLMQALMHPQAPQFRSPQRTEHTGVNPPRTGGQHGTCYSLRLK